MEDPYENRAPGVVGEFRELNFNGMPRLHIWDKEKWTPIFSTQDFEFLYFELRTRVIDYLSHPSLDGSKERLRKREELKGLVS